MKHYEAMFLFDNAAVHDWAAIDQEVRRLCGRINAELLVCVKYDERKLAYEIKRRKRGTYVLAYLNAPPERIGELERDVRLSDVILRALVLRVPPLTAERLAELRTRPADQPLSPGGGDGRRHDDDYRPRRERGPRDGEEGEGGHDRGEHDVEGEHAGRGPRARTLAAEPGDESAEMGPDAGPEPV